MCRLTRWSARAGVRQPKWSTSPTMLGMHALSIGAPLASRWVASRVVVLMRLSLQLARMCSPFCAIIYRFQSDMIQARPCRPSPHRHRSFRTFTRSGTSTGPQDARVSHCRRWRLRRRNTTSCQEFPDAHRNRADGVAGAQTEAKLLSELNRKRENDGHLTR